jgi:hypothetical protein
METVLLQNCKVWDQSPSSPGSKPNRARSPFSFRLWHDFSDLMRKQETTIVGFAQIWKVSERVCSIAFGISFTEVILCIFYRKFDKDLGERDRGNRQSLLSPPKKWWVVSYPQEMARLDKRADTELVNQPNIGVHLNETEMDTVRRD